MRPIQKYVYFIFLLTNETFVMRYGMTYNPTALPSLAYSMIFHSVSIKSHCTFAVEDG